MQVQRRPTTKDLDDAKLAMRSMMMPELAVWLVSLPKAIFRSAVWLVSLPKAIFRSAVLLVSLPKAVFRLLVYPTHAT